MKITEALQTLGYTTGATVAKEEIANRWKALCKKHHPDMGGHVEMMALVNDARDTLLHWLKEKPEAVYNTAAADYSVMDLFQEILDKIGHLPGIIIEVSGSWLWIKTPDKTHREVLKTAGCKWSRKKALWYWRPAGQKARKYRKGEWSMNKIRATWGSQIINPVEHDALIV